MLYVFEGVHQMLWDAQERTGKSIEEIAADFVKASRPSSMIQRVATVEEVANLRSTSPRPIVGNHGRRPQGRRRGRDYRGTETMRGLGCCWSGRHTNLSQSRALVELHWTDERIVECT